MQATALPNLPAPEPALAEPRPNIFALYEASFGLLLTPVVADELKAMEREYPLEWIADALKETAVRGNKNLKYTQKILERWKTEGRTARKPSKSWYDEYGKFIKR
jgi:DnaD/phage-associated family protein